MRTFQKRVEYSGSALAIVSKLLAIGNTTRIEIDDDRVGKRGILIIVHAPSIPNPRQWKETT